MEYCTDHRPICGLHRRNMPWVVCCGRVCPVSLAHSLHWWSAYKNLNKFGLKVGKIYWVFARPNTPPNNKHMRMMLETVLYVHRQEQMHYKKFTCLRGKKTVSSVLLTPMVEVAETILSLIWSRSYSISPLLIPRSSQRWYPLLEVEAAVYFIALALAKWKRFSISHSIYLHGLESRYGVLW